MLSFITALTSHVNNSIQLVASDGHLRSWRVPWTVTAWCNWTHVAWAQDANAVILVRAWQSLLVGKHTINGVAKGEVVVCPANELDWDQFRNREDTIKGD